MAEKEVSGEKKTIKISFWFLMFLVFIVFDVAYILGLHIKISALEDELLQARNDITSAQVNTEQRVEVLKENINLLIDEFLDEQRGNNNVQKPAEVTTGTYTSFVSGDEATLTMTLTLSDNNIAELTLNNESGDSTFSGTYAVEDGTVTFTSDDGLTVYSFTAVENGLRYVNEDVDLTLSK